MTNGSNGDFPEIDIKTYFEDGLSWHEKECFLRNKRKFLDLIYRVIKDIGLCGKIEHLTVSTPYSDPPRTEICRKDGPWPSKKLWLYIYEDRCRYMDERLLRHEFQHEADRWDEDMDYDPEIEKLWTRNPTWAWALTLAANISVDARLRERGLGEEFRRENFIQMVGKEHVNIFEDEWKNPPTTWSDIDYLAMRLLELRPPSRQQITKIGKKGPLSYRRRQTV